MAWQDDWHNPHDLPKVLRDMEQEKMDNGNGGFIATLLMVTVVSFVVCLTLSGCAVSISFQPASWKPAQTEAVTKSKAVER